MGVIMNPPLTAGCTALPVCSRIVRESRTCSSAHAGRDYRIVTGGLRRCDRSPWGVLRGFRIVMPLVLVCAIATTAAPATARPISDAQTSSTLM